MQRQPRLLTAPEQAAIRELADAIAAWWHAASTTVAERKAIIRQVVERVVVTVVGESERVEVTMMWAGGSQPQGTLIRPVGRLEQLSSYPQLCDRIRTLAAQGQSATAIAACLNAEGYRPAQQAVCFNRGSVEELIQRLYGIRMR